MSNDAHYYKRAFTLIELLLVVGIVGILASIVIAFIRPKDVFDSAHDLERQEHIRSILNGIQQFNIEYTSWPKLSEVGTIESEALEICVASGATLSFFCEFFPPKKVYLGDIIPEQLPTIPRDPDHNIKENPHGTSYFIHKDENNRIYISAPLGKDGQGIEISR